MDSPTFEEEASCHALGFQLVAGVDEVGRGCLAGPVVAAAVILDPASIPDGLNDSKQLSMSERERLDILIRERALALGVGMCSVEEIDHYNIFQASKMAMVRAVRVLNPSPNFLLVDGNFPIECEWKQKALVKGDCRSVSIAAASIVAKVFRDRLMVELDSAYPGYEFAKHKGYGSVEHRKVLDKQGRSPIHRKSFSWTPVRESV